MWPPRDDLHDLLSRELRAAVNARLADGTDPAEMAADLARRLAALREMTRAAPPAETGESQDRRWEPDR